MLEIKNLTKQYDQVVIDNLSIVFPSRGLVMILGRSGCGKTTLLNLIGGLDLNYQGEIYIDHQNIKEVKNYRRNHVGFIFQDFNLINWLNTKDNYLLPRFFTNIIFKRALEDQEEKLELNKLKKKKIKVLSGGQKQRVAMLRAMVKNVDILLCDEPSGSLDKENAKIVFDLLKKEAQERLVIVITHDEKLADEYGDYLYLMENGKLIEKQKHLQNNELFYCRLKKQKRANLFTLALLQYRSNFIRNCKITFGLTLALICIMITFTLSSSLKKQIHEQVNTIFPSQLVSIQSKDHQSISYQQLTELQILSKNQYLYGEMVDYEFMGISLTDQYSDENTIYISDMTKRVDVSKISYGRNLKADNEIVLSKTTAVHLNEDYQSLLNQNVYGFYLKDDQIEKIKLKIVGISDEVTIFDTMYINELANINHVSDLFEIEPDQIKMQIVMMNLDHLSNSTATLKELEKEFLNLEFKIAGKDISDKVDSFLGQIEKALLLFSLLSIIASCFLVGEVLYLSVVEKTKDIGIFKCLGASKLQILLLTLLESLVILTLSYLMAGMVLLELVKTINDLVALDFGFEGNFVTLDYYLLGIIYLLVLVFGFLSSILPASYASKLDPVKALKYQSY